MNHTLVGKSYLSTEDLGPSGLSDLLNFALDCKTNPDLLGKPLSGKSIGLLFFNSSLRTRTSMMVAVEQLGGHSVVLDVSGGVWKLETRDGVIMNSDEPEHIKEAIPVLSRYVDLLGVRCFSSLIDHKKDREDAIIRDIARYATVPVINLESELHHPCQSLADMMTIREKIGGISGKKIVLSWAPHPKPLPMAVANSFVLATCQLGADLWITNPPQYDLDPVLLNRWKGIADTTGGKVTQCSDQNEAFQDANIIYAKSWGSIELYGRWEEEKEYRSQLDSWMIDQNKMQLTNSAWFMHCLPVRRGVVVSDEVIDGPSSCVVDQAENRLHGQKSILSAMVQDRFKIKGS